MSASGSGQRAVSANGWNTRLYWLWILYNAVAFVTVLTAGFLLVALGSDVLHLSLASHHVVAALLIATLGAALFGGALGGCSGSSSGSGCPFPAGRGLPLMSARRCWPGYW
jgi:hypothetical protein